MKKYRNIIQEANGNWHSILTRLGVPAESLVNRHGSCPACGGKDRFRFDDKQGKGTFICTQWGNGGGDGISLVQHFFDCDFKTAIQHVRGALGINEAMPLTVRKTPLQAPQQPLQDDFHKLMNLWAIAAKNRSHKAIKTYLQGRGLDVAAIVPVLGNLGFVEALDYWETNEQGKPQLVGKFPAIIAKFESVTGELMGLHRTYLNPDYTSKLSMLNPFGDGLLNTKKMKSRYSGSTKGASIQLMASTDKLAVCEGIENAAAIYELSCLPVWACGSAHGMASLLIPSTVKQLFIFADTDANGTGRKAANKLCHKAQLQGVEVRIWESHFENVDVLDTLVMSKGKAA